MFFFLTLGFLISKWLLCTWISVISTNFRLRCMRLVEVIISLLVWSCPMGSSTDQSGKEVCTGFYLVITFINKLIMLQVEYLSLTLPRHIETVDTYQTLRSMSGLRSLKFELVDGEDKLEAFIGSRIRLLGRYFLILEKEALICTIILKTTKFEENQTKYFYVIGCSDLFDLWVIKKCPWSFVYLVRRDYVNWTT